MRNDVCLPRLIATKSCPKSIVAVMRRAGGLVLTPICAATIAPSALARDDIWAAAPMSAFAPLSASAAPLGTRTLARAPAVGAAAPTAAAQPGSPSSTADGVRASQALQQPTASAAGWDIYASANISAAAGRVGKANSYAVSAVPSIFLARNVGATRLALQGFVALPIGGAGSDRSIQSRMGVSWNYQPANDMEFSLDTEAARLSGDVFSPDRGLSPSHFSDDQLDVCGTFHTELLTCDRASIGARLLKRAGNFVVTAKATATAARWRPSVWSHQSHGSHIGKIEARISRRFSHQFEPYVETSMYWRHDRQLEFRRSRLVAGVLFPEISLLSARIYGGVDAPDRAPVLPAIGGALSWSPRRTIILGVRAEISAANALYGMMPETAAEPLLASWRAGRQRQAGAFLQWSLSNTIDMNLGAGWSQANWRRLGGYGPRVTEQYSDVTAAVTWAIAPQWLIRLDIAAIRRSYAAATAQRQVVAAISLRKAL